MALPSNYCSVEGLYSPAAQLLLRRGPVWPCRRPAFASREGLYPASPAVPSDTTHAARACCVCAPRPLPESERARG
jgi:hypothetical protein